MMNNDDEIEDEYNNDDKDDDDDNNWKVDKRNFKTGDYELKFTIYLL